jgi:hypothetical protein
MEGVAVGAGLGVGVGLTGGVAVGVAVAVDPGVGLGVGVGVGPTGEQTKKAAILMSSTRAPATPAATPLLSSPLRHFSLMLWPLAEAGRLTTVVM